MNTHKGIVSSSPFLIVPFFNRANIPPSFGALPSSAFIEIQPGKPALPLSWHQPRRLRDRKEGRKLKWKQVYRSSDFSLAKSGGRCLMPAFLWAFSSFQRLALSHAALATKTVGGVQRANWFACFPPLIGRSKANGRVLWLLGKIEGLLLIWFGLFFSSISLFYSTVKRKQIRAKMADDYWKLKRGLEHPELTSLFL